MADGIIPFSRQSASRSLCEDAKAAQIIAAIDRGRKGAENVISLFEDIDHLDKAYLRGMIERLAEVSEG